MDIGVLGIIIGVISIIITVIGIIVSVCLYFISKKRRKIIYNNYTTELIRNGISQIPELNIMWNNQKIENNLSITMFSLSNKGNRAIKPDDLSEELSIISTDKDTVILKAKVIEEENKPSKFSIEKQNDKYVKINFKNIDLKDEGEIQIIHTGNSKFIKLTGTILEHGDIKNITEYYKISDRKTSFLMFISAFTMIVCLLIFFTLKPFNNLPLFIVLFISGYILPVIVFISLYWNMGVDLTTMFKNYKNKKKILNKKDKK